MDLKKTKESLTGRSATVTLELVRQELDWICEKIERNMNRFGDHFPSACSENGRYRIKENDDWTNGFWTGMLWMAYLHTQDAKFSRLAKENIKSFQRRLNDHYVMDHHDIGFLYSLSVVAGYRITKDETLAVTILKAADCLAGRFQEKGGFIQAWGKLDCNNEYRCIIDSLLNLPLLYEASRLCGNNHYAEIADCHYDNLIRHIIRPDHSTYHTYYFNPKTGEPSHGATHQGFSDDSCWARGQSWAVLGIPLHERIRGTSDDRQAYTKLVDYFIGHLPGKLVPYWDLTFTDQDHQPYDSSALAIAACGLLEAEKLNYYEQAGDLAKGMLAVLKETCSSRQEDAEGLLLHGVYAFAEGKGIDQANLWGDYYYMEALMRLCKPAWDTFW